MTVKRPAFQFYPADWRKDAALQSCSLAAQGLWMNALCIAHECEPYGHLTINGQPMTVAQLGRLVGATAREAQALVDELLVAGAASRLPDGTLFSRRMVRDEEVRAKRAAGGVGGNEFSLDGVPNMAGGRRAGSLPVTDTIAEHEGRPPGGWRRTSSSVAPTRLSPVTKR